MPLIVIQKCPGENVSSKMLQVVRQKGGGGGWLGVGWCCHRPGEIQGQMLGSGICPDEKPRICD